MSLNDETRSMDGGYALGALHARVQALENRSDKQDTVNEMMNDKLDTIINSLAETKGSDARAASIGKWILSAVGSLGVIGGAVVAYKGLK